MFVEQIIQSNMMSGDMDAPELLPRWEDCPLKKRLEDGCHIENKKKRNVMFMREEGRERKGKYQQAAGHLSTQGQGEGKITTQIAR